MPSTGWDYLPIPKLLCLKFGNGQVISSHIPCWCYYLSVLGLKLIHVSKCSPSLPIYKFPFIVCSSGYFICTEQCQWISLENMDTLIVALISNDNITTTKQSQTQPRAFHGMYDYRTFFSWVRVFECEDIGTQICHCYMVTPHYGHGVSNHRKLHRFFESLLNDKRKYQRFTSPSLCPIISSTQVSDSHLSPPGALQSMRASLQRT